MADQTPRAPQAGADEPPKPLTHCPHCRMPLDAVPQPRQVARDDPRNVRPR